MVGLLEHADRVVSRRFQRPGDAIVLLGEGHGELGGSEYLKVVHDLVRGEPPSIDLDAERALQDLLVTLATERLIHSAHDCSDGGLAVTLAECCFDTEAMGADVSIPGVVITGNAALNTAAALFGESASRVLVSVVPEDATVVLERAAARNVPARMIGQTGGNLLRITVAGQMAVDLSIHEAERVWNGAIERYFARRVA